MFSLYRLLRASEHKTALGSQTILVTQPTHDRCHLNQIALRLGLCIGNQRNWNALTKSLVRTSMVEVSNIVLEHALQTPLAKGQIVIQALPF